MAARCYAALCNLLHSGDGCAVEVAVLCNSLHCGDGCSALQQGSLAAEGLRVCWSHRAVEHLQYAPHRAVWHLQHASHRAVQHMQRTSRWLGYIKKVALEASASEMAPLANLDGLHEHMHGRVVCALITTRWRDSSPGILEHLRGVPRKCPRGFGPRGGSRENVRGHGHRDCIVSISSTACRKAHASSSHASNVHVWCVKVTAQHMGSLAFTEPCYHAEQICSRAICLCFTSTCEEV
eukprot:1161385-Pelagomonas_calceolata.AAC.4